MLIQGALSNLVGGGRTVLVIARRLPTVAAADHIVVLRAGRVVATGPPCSARRRRSTLGRRSRAIGELIAYILLLP